MKQANFLNHLKIKIEINLYTKQNFIIIEGSQSKPNDQSAIDCKYEPPATVSLIVATVKLKNNSVLM